MDIVCCEHSPGMRCEFCGRIHFGVDDEEYDELSEKQDKEPDKYVGHHDVNGIAWGYIDAKIYVWNCPCDSAHKYEQWIWNNRKLICEYLKRRTTEALKQAEADAEMVEETINAPESSRRIIVS